MAGSFGYAREHFEVSHAIAEQRLLPAIRQKTPGTIVVAAGTSCRHQVLDFAGETAVHPAVLMAAHLDRRR
jgi:Fe-S oxidoreductase